MNLNVIVFVADIAVCPDSSSPLGYEGTIIASAGTGTDFECTVSLTDVIDSSVIELQLASNTLIEDCAVNYLEVTTSVDAMKICHDDVDKIYRYHTTSDDVTVKYKTTSYDAVHTFTLNYRGEGFNLLAAAAMFNK